MQKKKHCLLIYEDESGINKKIGVAAIGPISNQNLFLAYFTLLQYILWGVVCHCFGYKKVSQSLYKAPKSHYLRGQLNSNEDGQDNKKQVGLTYCVSDYTIY